MQHLIEPTWEDMLIDLAAQNRSGVREAMRAGDRDDATILRWLAEEPKGAIREGLKGMLAWEAR